MRDKPSDLKARHRRALAAAISEFTLKVRMRNPVDERLMRKILRLIHRGLRYAQSNLEWCQFMLYAITTLLTDGWCNVEQYPGDKGQLVRFLIAVYDRKVRPFGREYWDML
jgi:hypothetical protein